MSDTLALMVSEIPDDRLHERPGPHLNPVGWNYWHTLQIWDMDLNWYCKDGKETEDAWHRGDFTEKTGYDPDGKGLRATGIGLGYSDAEVDELQMGLASLQEYHDRLMSETETYLGSAEDMQRPKPSRSNPNHKPSVAERLQHTISHSNGHMGEARYAMGILGLYDALSLDNS